MIGQKYRDAILSMLWQSMDEIAELEKKEAAMFQEPDRKVKLDDIIYKSVLELAYGLNGKEQDPKALDALQEILVKQQHPGMLRRMGEMILRENPASPDYEKAMRFFEPAAVKKDGIADYYCEVLYGVGFGSEPPHYQLSSYWASANALDSASLVSYTASAEMTLALMNYEKYRQHLAKEVLFAAKKIQGYGDLISADAYLYGAAILGSPEGMYLFGRALASGDGCDKDEQKALFWLEEAAKRGFAEAEEPRDALRARGITPKDPEHLPSDHEIDEKDMAKVMQAELAESAPKEPEPKPQPKPEPKPQPKPEPKPQPKPEPKQQTEAERERIRQQQAKEEEERRKRAEEQQRIENERKRKEREAEEHAAALAKINRNPTSPEEQYRLAVRYATGDVVDRDPWLATEWYEKAAEQGHKKAQFDLALRYQYGDGAIRSTEMALKWYNRAALNGDRYAEHALGELLEELDHSSSSSAPKRSAISSKQLRKSRLSMLLFLAAAAVAFFAWRRIDVLYLTHLAAPTPKYVGLCAGYALLMLIGSMKLYRPRSLFLSLILPALGTAVFYFRLFPPAPVAIAGLYLLLAIARTLKGRRSLYGSSSNQRALIAEYRRTHKD